MVLFPWVRGIWGWRSSCPQHFSCWSWVAGPSSFASRPLRPLRARDGILMTACWSLLQVSTVRRWLRQNEDNLCFWNLLESFGMIELMLFQKCCGRVPGQVPERKVRCGVVRGTVRWYGTVVRWFWGTVRWYGTVVRYGGAVVLRYGTVVRYGGTVVRYGGTCGNTVRLRHGSFLVVYF